MNRTALLLSSTVLLAAHAVAQAPTAPAAELAKFSRLIGTWLGSGTARQEAGGEAMPWTATSVTTKVLGGHFVREDASIEVGMPAPLMMRNFFGYDANTKRYMNYGVDSMGVIATSEITWDDDDTMVLIATSKLEGRGVVDRWRTDFGKDGYAIHCTRAVGAGEPFTYVEGKYQRASEPNAGKTIAASFSTGAPSMPLPAPMKRWGTVLGTYDFAGWMIMGPGPKMDVSGVETIRPLFGGTAIEVTVKGQPMDYESWGVIGWNADKECFVAIGLSSMGAHVVEGRWVGNDMVFASAATMFGEPVVSRMIMHCDDAGQIVGVTSHTIQATGEPQKTFEAKYVKK